MKNQKLEMYVQAQVEAGTAIYEMNGEKFIRASENVLLDGMDVNEGDYVPFCANVPVYRKETTFMKLVGRVVS